MVVELDVFSGRPNPRWQLSQAETIDVEAALRDLPRTDASPSEPGLGYRGLILMHSTPTAGLVPRVRIHGGLITPMAEGGQTYRDIHGLERRLLLQAVQHGYPSMVQERLSELAAP
ncbi:MAG: hypothetical protein VKO39_12345 [Cyanobacteriota bacterium]|nr:hypothetical protein [Cyanobacteriota bacterium]